MSKNTFKIYTALVISALSCFLLNISISYASDPIGNWDTTQSLPNQLSGHASGSYNNKIYIFGGANSIVVPTNLSSSNNLDGSLNPWKLSSVTLSLYWITSIQNNNNIYILGGTTFPPSNSVNTVYIGSFDINGEIQKWQQLNSLPEQLSLGASTIVGNKIYYAGGFTTIDGSSSNAKQNIYSSPINSDGTIGTWTLAGTLPKALYGFGMIANGNNLVVIGGTDVNNNDQSGVYTAPVNLDGSVGSWTTTNALPQPVYRSSIVKIGSKIVSIGGVDNGIGLEEVYYADLNSDGTVGNWQTSQNFLPQPVCCGAAAATDNYIYLTGGYNSTVGYLDTVYYTKINTANDLNVPPFKQTSNPWQSQEYDTAHLWNPSDPTINAWGCALTSAAMIFNYQGIHELPDGTLLNPGTLNTWLKNQPDGYIGTGWVNWLALSRLSKLATSINGIKAFDALEYQRFSGSNISQLTSDINNGTPDILEEPGHFIVAKGTNGSTFDINDPYFNITSLDNTKYNNTFLSLSKFVPAMTDLSYIMLTSDPSVTLTVKDNHGNVVGSSFVQSPIIDPLNTSKTNSPIKIYYFPKPGSGTYTVTASNSNNPFTFTSYLYDQQGNPKIQVQNGFGNATFTITFNKTNSSNSTIGKNVTFASTIQDIQNAQKLHLLNNSLANALIDTLTNAQKQASKYPKVAKDLLNGGIKLLNVSQVNPQLVSPAAYNILSNDLIVLVNSL